MMAIESDKVSADVVEVSEFPHIAQRYQVYAVPKTVVNDQVEFDGARPEAMFVQALEQAVGESDEAGRDQESS